MGRYLLTLGDEEYEVEMGPEVKVYKVVKLGKRAVRVPVKGLKAYEIVRFVRAKLRPLPRPP